MAIQDEIRTVVEHLPPEHGGRCLSLRGSFTSGYGEISGL